MEAPLKTITSRRYFETKKKMTVSLDGQDDVGAYVYEPILEFAT